MYFRYIFNKYLPLDEGVVVHLNFNPLFPWIICVKFGLNLAMCIRSNSRKEEKIKSFQIVKRTDSRRQKSSLINCQIKDQPFPFLIQLCMMLSIMAPILYLITHNLFGGS